MLPQAPSKKHPEQVRDRCIEKQEAGDDNKKLENYITSTRQGRVYSKYLEFAITVNLNMTKKEISEKIHVSHRTVLRKMNIIRRVSKCDIGTRRSCLEIGNKMSLVIYKIQGIGLLLKMRK